MAVAHRIVAIPGMPGESIDSRILPDVEWILGHFKVRVTDGYSQSSVHKAAGDHPLGAGADIVPDTARGGSWDDVDALAKFAAEHPETFRWVGYDGRFGTTKWPNHGRGNHLHIGWHGFGVGGDSKPLHLAHGSGGGGLLSPATLLAPIGNPFGHNDPATGSFMKGATDVTVDAGAAAAKALVGVLVDAIGKDGARVLLSVALVAVAVAAIGFGAARAVGLRTPPIPIPAVKAAQALKGVK